MTWKINAQSSAARLAYSRIILNARDTLSEVEDVVRRLDQEPTQAVMIQLEHGLTMKRLRDLVARWRTRRAELLDDDSTAELQTFVRIATAETTFELATERTALRAAYASLVSEGRALHNSLSDNIAADGSVIESPTSIPKAQATAFLAACATFQTTVER
jgi:hypothetical protein